MTEKRTVEGKKRPYGKYIGGLCLILGISLPLSQLLKTDIGVLNFLIKFASYLTGKGALLLPVSLLYAAYCLLKRDSVRKSAAKTFTLAWISVCVLLTLHHFLVPPGEELDPSLLPGGGGLLGGLFALGLHKITDDAVMRVAVVALCWFAALCLALSLSGVKNILGKLERRLKQDSEKEDENAAKDFAEPTPQAITERNKAFSGAENRGRSGGNVYQDAEFGAFTKGLRKETGFRKILGYTMDSLQKKKTGTEEKDASIQLPEWQSEKGKGVVIRPVVNYGENCFSNAERGRKEAPGQGEDAVSDRLEAPVENQGPVKDFPERPKRSAESGGSVIKNFYKDYKEKSEEGLAKEETAVEDAAHASVSIFDSADKQEEAAEASDEPAAGDTETSEHAGEDVESTAMAYRLPPVELLDSPKHCDSTSEKDIMGQCSVLEKTLSDFKVRARVVAVTRGPSVTRFELEPAPGVKVSSVVNLSDDIALRLAAPGVRIEAPIPGKSAIGIEVPNIKNDPVCLREVIPDGNARESSSKLRIGLGKDISGNIIYADLAKMPHLLVAGSTGSGKSVCINTIISGILFNSKPDEVKLILVDPKVVELTNYNGIPHLLTPVVTEPRKAASALHWAVGEMERRYKTFADSRVREINSYNEQAQEKLPFIVIIIDELSDLMMVAKVDVEDAILRLAQKARAAGIHLILATQRPSVDVITGIVKANIPSRIAFAVSSQTDSRTIIDMAGAEKLLGKGDMLYYPAGKSKPVRVQGAFVSDRELERIVAFIIRQSVLPEYKEEVTQQELESSGKGGSEEATPAAAAEDELFVDALELVLDMGQASSSMLQRRFRIGYTRAARLVDTMEELGIVGHSVGSKPREVIMSRQEAEERFMQQC